MQPAIKWSGSKRPMAKEIVSLFPEHIETYYEPFCGSCAVLAEFLQARHNADKYVCSDLNSDLIALWKAIKDAPEEVSKHYTELWNEFNAPTTCDHRKEFFFKIRDEYNKNHNPLYFMFIMRTTTNGMPHYNSDGQFNNSCHFSRAGIEPAKLQKIVCDWSCMLNKYDVEFRACSYTDIHATADDFMFLDPPYANTKGMYFGGFDNAQLWTYLRTQPCGYVLTYDGISGNVDNTYKVPADLYDGMKYVYSGNSSFKRVIGKSKDSYVQESVYWRYKC